MESMEGSPRLKSAFHGPSSLALFRGIHRGERVAILANGPSLNDHDLSRIKCKVIGVNRAWEKYECDYLCIVEAIQLEPLIQARQEINWLFCGGVSEEHLQGLGYAGGAVHIPAKNKSSQAGIPMLGWSWDLEKGVFYRGVSYMALQAAVFMGFREIIFVALDLKPRDGHGWFYEREGEPAPRMQAAQCEAFGYAAGLLDKTGVRVYNSNPKSACTAFPRVPFNDLFTGEEGL